jgi:hypothetical protein
MVTSETVVWLQECIVGPRVRGRRAFLVLNASFPIRGSVFIAILPAGSSRCHCASAGFADATKERIAGPSSELNARGLAFVFIARTRNGVDYGLRALLT